MCPRLHFLKALVCFLKWRTPYVAFAENSERKERQRDQQDGREGPSLTLRLERRFSASGRRGAARASTTRDARALSQRP